jgi:hypothetical protein
VNWQEVVAAVEVDVGCPPEPVVKEPETRRDARVQRIRVRRLAIMTGPIQRRIRDFSSQQRRIVELEYAPGVDGEGGVRGGFSRMERKGEKGRMERKVRRDGMEMS